ncbi:hypothetical protein [Bacterioplanes sanyensis]|uniref:hypothetical protein n=1 Tax=Bacterioplanes sanyensis TaxID=1249553 RepID=UPI001E36D6D3|nr:hypothetical protein [Bacterioplanes sanyensis]
MAEDLATVGVSVVTAPVVTGGEVSSVAAVVSAAAVLASLTEELLSVRLILLETERFSDCGEGKTKTMKRTKHNKEAAIRCGAGKYCKRPGSGISVTL